METSSVGRPPPFREIAFGRSVAVEAVVPSVQHISMRQEIKIRAAFLMTPVRRITRSLEGFAIPSLLAAAADSLRRFFHLWQCLPPPPAENFIVNAVQGLNCADSFYYYVQNAFLRLCLMSRSIALAALLPGFNLLCRPGDNHAFLFVTLPAPLPPKHCAF